MVSQSCGNNVGTWTLGCNPKFGYGEPCSVRIISSQTLLGMACSFLGLSFRTGLILVQDHPAMPQLDRRENLSQHSAPMQRKRSSGSRGLPNIFPKDQVSPLTINTFQASDDEPFSSYKMRRTASGRRPLQRLSEVAVYNNPADFYTFSKDTNNNQQLPITPRRPRRHSYRPSLSPFEARSFSNMSTLSQSPATTTTSGLTNPTTFASGMSRQSSIASGSVCEGMDMIRLDSHRSDGSNCSMEFEQSHVEHKQSLVSPNNCTIRLSENDRSHLLDYTGGVNSDSTLPNSPLSSVVSVPVVPTSLVEDVGMERTSSMESNISSQSRASRRRQEQIVQSSRLIAPKPSDNELSMSRCLSASSQHMKRIESADGSSKEVMLISKTPYVRPAHEKIKCKECNEKPDGFRGEHELRRHIERAHSVLRKAFVCIDMSEDKKFLANCKACRLNKKYGAYYNAAAHLRRTHFHPKQKGQKGKGKTKPEEKRGGIGGGNSPSMDVLKMWMKEVEEFVPENMPPLNDYEALEDSLDGAILDRIFDDHMEAHEQGQSSNTKVSVDTSSCDTTSEAFGIPSERSISAYSSSAPAQSRSIMHQSPSFFTGVVPVLPQHPISANDYEQSPDDSQLFFDMDMSPSTEFDASNFAF